MSTIVINKKTIKTKSITTLVAVTAALALPQLFHAIGAVSGLGNTLGSAFLPMHLPVLLAGFLAGPVAGVIAGAVSPLISFALSGMPALGLLPFMVIELAGYGLAAGLLSKTKMPLFGKLLLTQLIGRLLRAAGVLLAVYAFESQTAQVAQIWNMVLEGLPGIILQWALIPLLLYRMEGLKKYYE